MCRAQVAHTLRQVGVLQTLTLLQVHQLCDVLTEEVYEPGQKIITQVCFLFFVCLRVWCEFVDKSTSKERHVHRKAGNPRRVVWVFQNLSFGFGKSELFMPELFMPVLPRFLPTPGAHDVNSCQSVGTFRMHLND